MLRVRGEAAAVEGEAVAITVKVRQSLLRERVYGRHTKDAIKGVSDER